jgi:hypothetical protein
MNNRIKYRLKILLGMALLSLLAVSDAYPQGLLSKKERKSQFQQAQADRLFIEGQRYLMLEDYEKAYPSPCQPTRRSPEVWTKSSGGRPGE